METVNNDHLLELPPIFVFDLDDSLYDCSTQLRKMLKYRYGIDISRHQYVTDENTGGVLSQLHKSGDYMLTMELYPELSEFGSYMNQLGEAGYESHACSHRGYHPRALEYSMMSFDKYGLEFDEIHLLDPRVTPCKITYLNRVFKGRKYYLFDDNPKGCVMPGLIIEDPHVFLIDQPHNANVDCEQRIKPADIMKVIASIHNNRTWECKSELILK